MKQRNETLDFVIYGRLDKFASEYHDADFSKRKIILGAVVKFIDETAPEKYVHFYKYFICRRGE